MGLVIWEVLSLLAVIGHFNRTSLYGHFYEIFGFGLYGRSHPSKAGSHLHEKGIPLKHSFLFL